MQIQYAELETVCGITSTLPENQLPEVAFAGRSNAGKSTLINFLLGRKGLAHTSSQPGKTQTINYYNVNRQIYLVDIPGYGYARAGQKEMEKWGDLVERYLTTSEMLRAVFLLVDIRHDPSEQDRQMLDWIRYLELQPIVLATKCDKVNRSQLSEKLDRIGEVLQLSDEDILLPVSALGKQGREDVLDLMLQVVENEG